jgi:hypothetical protein
MEKQASFRERVTRVTGLRDDCRVRHAPDAGYNVSLPRNTDANAWET